MTTITLTQDLVDELLECVGNDSVDWYRSVTVRIIADLVDLIKAAQIAGQDDEPEGLVEY